MQVVNQNDIEKRILFYWSKLYISGIKSGEDYNKLKKTISILLLNHELPNLKEILKGHTEWKIREKHFKNTVLTEMLEVHIIELPKVKRIIKTDNIFKEDETFKIWTKFLLMPNELEEKEIAKKLLSKSFKIEEIVEITGLTKEEIDKL